MLRRGLGTIVVLAGMLATAALGFWLGRQWSGSRTQPGPTPFPQPQKTESRPRLPTPTSTASPTPTKITTPLAPALETPFSWEVFPRQGLLLFGVREGPDPRLFAYHPQKLPWVRLMRDTVRTPALDPSGRWVALSLKRETWRLALLDLATGNLHPLAPVGLYEAGPTWSPDGQWLAYEALVDGNLDVWIRPSRPDAGPQEAIRLTHATAPDFAPAWSPQGRAMAFVSWRTGSPQVFVVNLDAADTALQVSREEAGNSGTPAWSPDGRYLAWSQERDGIRRVWVWDATQPEKDPVPLGEGAWPRWRPDGHGLWVVVPRPEGDYLSQYTFPDAALALPLLPLPGAVEGFTAGYSALPEPLPPALAGAARMTPTPLWSTQVQPVEGLAPNQVLLVRVPNVEAEYPYLSDAVDEAFATLRELVQARLGWDPLTRATLYLPPTWGNPLPQDEPWMSTGRAFALPMEELLEGRMAVVREAYPEATYWRVYLRAQRQDGSQGRPLTQGVWDFVQGRESPPPSGFWVDFTALAQALGWERLPAQPSWPHYYPAARFHVFVHRSGLTWVEAFRAVHTGTGTPTPLWPTPTPTFTPTATLSPIPTGTAPAEGDTP